MGTRTSSGLQDSTREGVADVCLLHVGGGQLINCIISRAVGFPLSWCYGGLLVDFEQSSSIILIDKTWVHLDWSSPTPILYIHRLSIGWLILAEAWRFRRWNPREFWSKSLRGGDGERKARWNSTRSAAHIWTQVSVHLRWRRHFWKVFLEAQILSSSQWFCS